MPGNVENIKGIGLSVVADATQIRRTFEEAISGLRDRTVQMKLSVVKDSSFERVMREIRNTRVTIDIALSPSRDTVRQIRRDLKTKLEAEGGVPIPVKIQALSQAEGARIRAAIEKSIGTPTVDVILNPQYAGGGGGGGGGGQVGGGALRQPVEQARAPQGASPAPAAPVGARGAASGRVASFARQEAESEEEWQSRLLDSRATFLDRLESNSERTRRRANNALVDIDKRLGIESDRQRIAANQPAPLIRGATNTAAYPERVTPAGERVRGGPDVGALPPGGATDWEKVARLFFENVSRRSPDRGFRGQRVQRSFLQPGLGLNPEEEQSRRAENRSRVEAGKEIVEGSFDEVFASMPDDFRKAFTKGIELVKGGDLGLAKESLGATLDDLLARGAGRKVPGVGPRTVQRILDPTRGESSLRAFNETPEAAGRLAQQQAFAFQVNSIRDLIGAITTTQSDVTANTKARRRRRRKAVTEPSELEPGEILAKAEERFPLNPVKVKVEDVEPSASRRSAKASKDVAFEGVGAPPGVGGGGGQGGAVFPFPTGGGGAVPVEVINWPGSLVQQGGTVAAQPVVPASADFERMFQPALEGLAAAAGKIGTTAPASGKTKGRTGSSRVSRGHLAPTNPRGVAAQLVGAGLISPEAAGAILEPPVTGAPSQLDIARQGIEEQLAQARQGLPIRGFAVSVAQQLAGEQRGATFARFQRAGQFLGQAGGVSRQAADVEKEVKLQQAALDSLNAKQDKAGKLTKQEQGYRASLTKSIDQGRQKLTEYAKVQEDLVGQASELAKLTGGEKLANLGKSLVGSLGGTLAFGAALGAVGAGLSAISIAAVPVLERLTGYASATRDISGALAEQQKQQKSSVQALVAQDLAMKAFSADTVRSIGPIIEQRVATEAANKALEERQRTLAAARNIGRENAQFGGQDAGLFQTTGGVNFFGLQTPFFGTPSTQEVAGRELAQLPTAAQRGQATGFPQDQNPIDRFFDMAGSLFGGPRPEEDRTSAIAEATTQIDAFNDAVEKGAISQGRLVEANEDAAKKSAELFRAAGLEQIADQLTNKGLAVQGVQTPAQAQAFALSYQRGALRPDPETLLAAAQEPLKATIFQIQQNLKNTLETFLPAQRGIALSAQPVAPFSRGLLPQGSAIPGSPLVGAALGGGASPAEFSGVSGIGGQFGGVPEEAITSFNRYRDEAQRAIDSVNAKAQEGRQVLAQQLGVPESTITQLQAFGTRIDEIGAKQQDLRLDLQYSQYNRQLFLARRTLGDIAGLLGKTGGTQVGLLQREQLLLSRRSQSLSLQSQQLSLQTGELQQQSAELGQQQNFLQLQQSQRQINFQRAVAGFTAPGLTPEERRARIQEAELEADYAQKQLNFQKEQFKLQQDQIAINREQLGFQREAFALAQAQYQNQVALQDALSGRAYEDQLAAIAELQKAFATGVEIQALENLKVAITRQRDIFVEELNAQVQAEMDFIKAESQFAADLMAQTGRFATNLVSRVKQVFDDIRRQNGWFFGGSFGDTSGENATRNRIPEGTEPSGRYNAPGMLSMVSQPTQMTMGDAGGELVAVLRNPKPVLDFGSRQQATILAPIQINVTGNTVRNDSDLETLALQVSRLVEERMGRRMTTLGITVAR